MRLLIMIAATVLMAGCNKSPSVAHASAAASTTDETATVPLPSAEQILIDYKRMVNFGPRLPGYKAHDQYVSWLEDEFVKAGLNLLPCDQYNITRWQPKSFGLDILTGSNAGPVDVPTYSVRAASTGPEGVAGPLMYASLPPAPSLSSTDTGTLQAAVTGYPGVLGSWASGLSSFSGGSLKGSILLVDIPIPLPITTAVFLPISTYRYWPDHSDIDWMQIDYKRPWLGPWPDSSNFSQLGVAGVIFIADASKDELRGNYSSHTATPQSLPALVVDRDTGAKLRQMAAARPQVRLTLDAANDKIPVRNTTAVLPGKSDEVIIVASHTDGQNVFEENGGVAALQIARHFASLPPAQRPQRTLVFATYPGHMSGESHVADAGGWIAAHPDIVKKAVGAVHIEHLGATEWLDKLDKGYRGTGENEVYGIWTTQGPVLDLTREALMKADLHRTALLRGPLMITPGAAFHNAGVPFVGGIAGPTYLLQISQGNGLDKLDADLAARQTAFYADVVRRMDATPASSLKSGDPLLGSMPPSSEDVSTKVACGPGSR